jgi:hypothetical protein
MRGIVHPFTRALYELDLDGNIVVTKDGVSGTFTRDGRHLRGELRECDPQLCGWVGGPQIANHRVSKAPVDRS